MTPRELKISAILSYAALFLNMGYSLFLIPVFTRVLGQGEYALYSVCMSTLGYLAMTGSGLLAAYNSYYSRFAVNGKITHIKQLNGALFLMFGIFGSVVCVCGFVLSFRPSVLFGSQLSVAEYMLSVRLLRVLALIAFVQMITAVFEIILSAHEKFIFYRLMQILYSIMLTVVTVVLLSSGFHSDVVLWAVLIMVCLVGVVYAAYVLRRNLIPLSFGKIPAYMFGNMLSFAAFIFLQNVLNLFNTQLDKILVMRYVGTEAAGVYAIGANLANVLVSFGGTIALLFVPTVNRIVAEDKPDMNKALTDKLVSTGRLLFFVLMLVFTGMVIFGKPFIHYFAGEGYDNAYTTMLLIAFPLAFSQTICLGQDMIRAKQLHHKLIMLYFILIAVTIVIRAILVKHFGVHGAAMGTSINLFLTQVIVTVVFFSWAAGLQMSRWVKALLSIIPSLIVPSIVGAAIMRFIVINSPLKLALYIIVYTFLFSVSVWLWGMNDNERDLLYNPLKKSRR